ncbi:hypothetical protein T492DRAFT_938317 [Pavlovales sp. CCMP2436]|nr:hypothetical protein T492DRAFT_938317 [Pavlovales sp. CCMP2436]
MSRKKSHVGRNLKGSLERRPRDGLDGAASPFKARGARTSRGRRLWPHPAHRAPRAPRAPRETLNRSSVRELAAARSPAGAHAVRARREGVPRGGGGGVSCLARRTSEPKFVLKAQHDSAMFGAMILEIARDPAQDQDMQRHVAAALQMTQSRYYEEDDMRHE